jgi:hypothetical protein
MSKIPTLLDALVSAFQGAAGLSDAEVTDGPVVTDSAAPDWVVVGFDGDPEGDFTAAFTESDWNSLGVSRGEQINIPVAVVVSRGDTEVRPAREAAFAYYSAISEILSADPTLGIPQTQAAVTTSSLHQSQTTNGIQVRLALDVTCNTLG